MKLAKHLSLKTTYKATMASFEMANIEHETNFLPTNTKSFWKLFNHYLENFKQVWMCTFCLEEVGNNAKPERDCECHRCGPLAKNKTLSSTLYINLPRQLIHVLNLPGMEIDLLYPYTRAKRNNNTIEDVYDGSKYIEDFRPPQTSFCGVTIVTIYSLCGRMALVPINLLSRFGPCSYKSWSYHLELVNVIPSLQHSI